MNGIMYGVRSGSRSLTAADTDMDLIEILAPADAIIVVHRINLINITDVGDAEEEIIALESVRGVPGTSGSGGASATPQPLNRGAPASGATVEVHNTTRMSATVENLSDFGWNVRIPLDHVFTPEDRPVISASDRWALGFAQTLADTMSVFISCIFEEIGG